MKYELIGDNNYEAENIIQEILKNRNIKNIDDFFNLDEGLLRTPFIFENMSSAVWCLARHIKKQNNITIISDSDPDGVSSTAIIHNYIKKINKDINIELVVHPRRDHGIFLSELNGKLKNIDLLIVPDAGSGNYKEHKILKNRFNIDIIVIDHHDVEYYSKNAIVVNNQLSNILHDLSGSGMTYMFCKAFDEQFGIDYADEYLDLAALGMISDMMSLKSKEVQYIVRKGLKQIKNKAFQALIDKQYFSIRGEVTPANISFYIAPLINAVFRLGNHEDRIALNKAFCNIDHDKIFIYKPTRGKNKNVEIEENIFENTGRRCDNLNKKRRLLGEKIFKEIKSKLDDKNKILIVEIDKSHGENGMARIVCNNITKKYQRPSIAYYVNEKGEFRGSMASNIDKFKDLLNETDLFEFVAGHQRASGLKIKKSKMNVIQEELNKKFKDYNFENIYRVDFVVPYMHIEFFNSNFIPEIYKYRGYYGRGIEEPKILIKNVTFPRKNVKLLGKKQNTIKIVCDNITFINFKTNVEEYKKLVLNHNTSLNIIGRCSVNKFMGKTTNQIIIENYEILS